MQTKFPLRQNSHSFRYPAVLTAGFRVYFLFAGLFSVFAMVAWVTWLGVHAAGGAFLSVPMSMAPHLWHAHEMVYGYTVAVMAGFFLTAVPNWTGTREAVAAFVSVSALIWLLGRLAIWFSGVLEPWFVALADLAFIPVLASNILGKLAQKSQLRNLVFLALLCGLFAGNLMMHLEWTGLTEDTAGTGVRLGILIAAAMIAVIGGRVVPAFTRNALNRDGYKGKLPETAPWLDRLAIVTALLAVLACLPVVPQTLAGLAYLLAGITNLTRLAGWKGWVTFKSPILWILHLAFLLLCFGYLAYGTSLLMDGFSQTAALHLLAAGAVGSMTLAMMTRASLGHSGLPLKVDRLTATAYVLVIAGALIRTFGTFFWDYFQVMLVSGAFWIAGFGLFVLVYAPILCRPRNSK